MKSKIISLAVILILSGCASITPPLIPDDAKIVKNENKEFNTLLPPAGGPVVAAVYGFSDKTGQRKPSEKLANISFAVTQGAEVYVIKALQEVGQGRWFKVVERVGLDNLTKERQIIRQARESVGDQRQLKPMMFAGIMVEGGIIGYDSNTLTGGAGARWLGIGPSTQYRQDVVTVNMRAVSVQTGEVLVSVTVTKSIVSVGTSLAIFKFFDQGTQSFESEIGFSVNEPVNYAIRSAIEQSVVEMIKEGDRKGFWAFRGVEPIVVPVAPDVPKVAVPQEVVKSESTPVVVPAKVEVLAKVEAPTEEPKKEITPVQVKQVKYGVAIDYVNIRKEQTIGSERVTSLKPNTKVEVLQETNTHYLVKVDGKEGWIYKTFIKVQ
jgi:curli production assembly/transport component CsgG